MDGSQQAIGFGGLHRFGSSDAAARIGSGLGLLRMELRQESCEAGRLLVAVLEHFDSCAPKRSLREGRCAHEQTEVLAGSGDHVSARCRRLTDLRSRARRDHRVAWWTERDAALRAASSLGRHEDRLSLITNHSDVLTLAAVLHAISSAPDAGGVDRSLTSCASRSSHRSRSLLPRDSLK